VAEQKVRRRLAAILAADIAGYSRLMGEDDVATVRDLKGHQVVVLPLIGEFGGRIIDTAGDGILAEFPSAVDAVECAIQLQDVMATRNKDTPETRRMQFRVGINLGDVIHDDVRIYGDGINVAARLENIAEPGGICISEDVHRQIRDKLTVPCRDLGEKDLKNIARRVRTYALGGSVTAEEPVSAPSAPSAPPLSIAVLPFVNMSRNEENEYFADGLSEELLNVLAKIRGLRVTSRTSAFSFKGKDIDIPTIAKKLGVAHVLEGSVRTAGKRVRVTAQLIEVAQDSHIWSDTYDRELDDIFAVQDDIAQCVVQELRARLLGTPQDAKAEAQKVIAEVQAASKGRSENPEAFRHYLQGQFFRDQLNRESTARAVECYEVALKLDPEYALAWAGLSRALTDQMGQNWVPRDEGFRKAIRAAEQAIELEPDLPEAHTAHGWIVRAYNWDWRDAEESFQRALELAPGSTIAMNAAATLMGNLGKFDEAIALFRRAIALDPLNVPLNRNLGLYCLASGALDDAQAALDRTLQLSGQGGLTRTWRALVELEKGNLDGALAEAEKEVSEIFKVVTMAVVRFARGEIDASEAALNDLIARFGADSPYQVAEVYGARGEADKAFEWLERTFAKRDPGLSYVKIDPFLKRLHGDTRWQILLEKMRLAD
jgi:TolB-like protein/class 3 adenylate cyclase/Tfp pilus assembly protein PilF